MSGLELILFLQRLRFTRKRPIYYLPSSDEDTDAEPKDDIHEENLHEKIGALAEEETSAGEGAEEDGDADVEGEDVKGTPSSLIPLRSKLALMTGYQILMEYQMKSSIWSWIHWLEPIAYLGFGLGMITLGFTSQKLGGKVAILP